VIHPAAVLLPEKQDVQGQVVVVEKISDRFAEYGKRNI
jgi:hypothetical protein